MDRPQRRSRRDLEEVGEAPDYRFSLANERTFLAWVRSSLALMAAGVAVVSFVPDLPVVRHGLGFLLIALGGIVASVSYRHWFDNELAMREGRRLPVSMVPRLVAAALGVAALVALTLVVADLVG